MAETAASPTSAKTNAEKKPGDYAGEKQFRYGNAPGDAEQDEADAWRNHWRDNTACRNQSGRIHLPVACRDHHRHKQSRKCRSIRGCRP